MAINIAICKLMDLSFRIMKQIEISTSLTLVSFLSKTLQDFMTLLDMTIISVMIFIITYVIGTEYVLSPLSRKLALLLIMDRLRPIFNEMISSKNILEIQGIIIAVGVICIMAVLPKKLRENPEIDSFLQSLIYLYSDILSFLSKQKNNHICLFCIGITVMAIKINYEKQSSKIFKLFLNIMSIAFTSLIIQITQMYVVNEIQTAIIQNLLLFTIFHFVHLTGLESVEDYIVFNISMYIQSYITSDQWFWIAVLFIILQILLMWLETKSAFIQVLILTIVSCTVKTILQYIKNLAVHDTIITLKTSAIVLQFVIHELSREFLSKRS